ncbi:hypothetical protein [Salinisphaera aquimarina]|uniref:Uncharacterized protein n=1 Tax=Salinisphaera aquimarina TaxID=2094031 RepID=A0ABV7EUC5_9GAMM
MSYFENIDRLFSTMHRSVGFEPVIEPVGEKYYDGDKPAPADVARGRG